MIALATACAVLAYMIGWMLGFRFADRRCRDCHEPRAECVCVTIDPWDDEPDE